MESIQSSFWFGWIRIYVPVSHKWLFSYLRVCWRIVQCRPAVWEEMYDLAFPQNRQRWLHKQVETLLVWSVLLCTYTSYVFKEWDVGHPTPLPLLPQKEMAKATSALKPQILQNYFLTSSYSFVRSSRGWLWLFRSLFLKRPSSPALLSGICCSSSWLWLLGTAQEGSRSCPAGICLDVSPLKWLDVVKEQKSLHLFLAASQNSPCFIYYHNTASCVY